MTHRSLGLLRSPILSALPLAFATLLACSDDDTEVTPAKKDAGSTQKDSGAGKKTDSGSASKDAGAKKPFNFFVASDTSKTANLGGLKGADARCQALAKAVGADSKTWHAYLSVEKDEANGGAATNARDRIGKGPWYNIKGELLAEDLAALHSRNGDAELFLDENGKKINGQWTGSPTPNEHDVLTGTAADGSMLPGKTCADWTSEETTSAAQVGHSDGLGPSQNPNPPYNSWNSSHESMNCSDTAPRGGAGHIYCFAIE